MFSSSEISPTSSTFTARAIQRFSVREEGIAGLGSDASAEEERGRSLRSSSGSESARGKLRERGEDESGLAGHICCIKLPPCHRLTKKLSGFGGSNAAARCSAR
ncbi:MAG TPA: hypothetical protein DIT13_01005 [Verrucomicrobiales bacterium]|nr:hypothetical protein [Verrucomicrobiales bacterium]